MSPLKRKLAWLSVVVSTHTLLFVLLLSTTLGWHDRTPAYRLMCAVLSVITFAIIHKDLGEVTDTLDEIGDRLDRREVTH